MGRRAVVLVAAAVLALVATGGMALADNMQGNGDANRLSGTAGKDVISGGGGGDDIFGKGGQDRLMGDSGNDRVYGGNQGDRLQAGMGQDDLYGQTGSDFLNAIDGQTNDLVDCGEGEFDVAAIDGFLFSEDADEVAPNCEMLYVGVPIGGPSARGEASTDLSAIDTPEEAAQAEADGLLRQIR